MYPTQNYVRMFAVTGTLDAIDIRDILDRLTFLEETLGAPNANPYVRLNDEVPSMAVPVKDFYNSITIVNSAVSYAVDVPAPPEDYIKERLLYNMAPNLVPLATFSEETFRRNYFHQNTTIATLYIFKKPS